MIHDTTRDRIEETTIHDTEDTSPVYPSGLTELERQFVLCLCRNDLNLSKTAREMHYHLNTIKYKAKRIEDKTGCSPVTFFGAMQLLVAIHADG